MTLGSTQPLTEMRTRNLPGEYTVAGASQTYGPPRSVTGIAFHFTNYIFHLGKYPSNKASMHMRARKISTVKTEG
jgi:hypothetical protein